MKKNDEGFDYDDYLKEMNLKKLMNTINEVSLGVKNRREVEKIKRKAKELRVDIRSSLYQGERHKEIFSELLNVLLEHYQTEKKKEQFLESKSKQRHQTLLIIRREDKVYRNKNIEIRLWLNRVEPIFLDNRCEEAIWLMDGKHTLTVESIQETFLGTLSSEKKLSLEESSYFIPRPSGRGSYELDLNQKTTLVYGLIASSTDVFWSNKRYKVYMKIEH